MMAYTTTDKKKTVRVLIHLLVVQAGIHVKSWRVFNIWSKEAFT